MKLLSRFIITALLAFCSISHAAVVHTTFGEREGRVIVRRFDSQKVVTLITKDKRIFQYYSDDVKLITSEQEQLVSRPAFLREGPTEAAAAVFEDTLVPGMEVLTTGKEEAGWVEVKAWGNTTGWIKKDALTDSVEFLPEPLIPRNTLFNDSAGEVSAATSVTNATNSEE